MLVSLKQCQVSKVTVVSQKLECVSTRVYVWETAEMFGIVFTAILGHYDAHQSAARLFAQ